MCRRDFIAVMVLLVICAVFLIALVTVYNAKCNNLTSNDFIDPAILTQKGLVRVAETGEYYLVERSRIDAHLSQKERKDDLF